MTTSFVFSFFFFSFSFVGSSVCVCIIWFFRHCQFSVRQFSLFAWLNRIVPQMIIPFAVFQIFVFVFFFGVTQLPFKSLHSMTNWIMHRILSMKQVAQITLNAMKFHALHRFTSFFFHSFIHAN